MLWIEKFQSTHPLRGATFRPRFGSGCGWYFNPRTPCGVRRALHRLIGDVRKISIHAPLAGCDQSRSGSVRNPQDFNPRTPCGVRPPATAPWRICAIFQSTHPLRGATRPRGISFSASRFQSTHPLRGATNAQAVADTVQAFQSTHPLRGATRRDFLRRIQPSRFQSTHPLRGATADILVHVQDVGISIHAPLAGCDDLRAEHIRRYRYFNPRTPCGVRRFCACLDGVEEKISIHAPLAGCDSATVTAWDSTTVFQSTHPLRGATKRA